VSPTFRACFRFPVSTREARRDLAVGGALMFLLPIGWLLNMGHRLDTVYRVWHGEPPYFRGFRPWTATFRRGLTALTAVSFYLAPSVVLAVIAYFTWPTAIGWAAAILAVPLFLLANFVTPGGQTRNAARADLSYLSRPSLAWGTAVAGGRAYLKAWAIALTAIALSFLGLLAAGIGFFWTSVWAWSVVGYAFTEALQDRPET
jgi:hypothetical protein